MSSRTHASDRDAKPPAAPAAGAMPPACHTTMALARLEVALRHLEALLDARDAEIRRLRRIETAAAATLVTLDAYLDGATGARLDAAPGATIASAPGAALATPTATRPGRAAVA